METPKNIYHEYTNIEEVQGYRDSAQIVINLSHTASSDYIASQQFLTFTPSRTMFNLDIGIVDNFILEGTEGFSATASLVSNDAPRVSISLSETAVTILDNDSKKYNNTVKPPPQCGCT